MSGAQGLSAATLPYDISYTGLVVGLPFLFTEGTFEVWSSSSEEPQKKLVHHNLKKLSQEQYLTRSCVDIRRWKCPLDGAELPFCISSRDAGEIGNWTCNKTRI